MPKIALIEPKAPDLHIFSQFRLPRLGIFVLATLMKRRGWEVTIFFEENAPIDFACLRDADLVGISTITSTAPRAYAIADSARKLGKTVIMGGPHVTFLTDEALEHADFVVRGEGERALMAFVDHWETDKDYRQVPGLSFHGQGVQHNPMPDHIADLDTIPYPDPQLFQGHLTKLGRHRIIPVQTSRGCPFDCSFCSVTGMFGKRYRFRSTEHIIAELRQYDDPHNYVFFYDDNFTASKRRTKALLDAMIAEKFRFKWSTQVRADVVKDLELVQTMKRAGCHTLFIGFESVNPDSLKAMKKGQTVDDIMQAARILNKQRIHVHGMFVYGFDQDDWRTVRQTVRFAKKACLTSSQFLILTPLPGSQCYRELKEDNRITFHDWALYDAHHVVFTPARFSLFDLQKAQIFSHRKFYSLLQTIKKLFKARLIDISLAHYARRLNHMWRKRNRLYLRLVKLLSQLKDAKLHIDYRRVIKLNE